MRESDMHSIQGLYADLNLTAAITALCEHSLFSTQLGKELERKVVALTSQYSRKIYAAYDKSLPQARKGKEP